MHTTQKSRAYNAVICKRIQEQQSFHLPYHLTSKLPVKSDKTILHSLGRLATCENQDIAICILDPDTQIELISNLSAFNRITKSTHAAVRASISVVRMRILSRIKKRSGALSPFYEAKRARPQFTKWGLARFSAQEAVFAPDQFHIEGFCSRPREKVVPLPPWKPKPPSRNSRTTSRTTSSKPALAAAFLRGRCSTRRTSTRHGYALPQLSTVTP